MTLKINIPKRLPLLELPNNVLMPGAINRIPVPYDSNKTDIDNWTSLSNGEGVLKTVFGIIPCSEDKLEPRNEICTAGSVLQYSTSNVTEPSYILTVLGLTRTRILKVESRESAQLGLPVAVVEPLVDCSDATDEELTQMLEEFKEVAMKVMQVLDTFHPLMGRFKKLARKGSSSALIDVCASLIPISFQEKLDILNAVDVKERVKKIMPLLKRNLAELGRDKKNDGSPIIKFLRTKMSFPGGIYEENDDLAELQEKLKAANLPSYVQKVALRELQRLKRMGPFNQEHAVIRNYLELVLELPWSISSNDTLDLKKARMDLDADHYGMEKLKKRVLEYLAVRQLKNNLRGPILCFVGPPGVGKTSIGRSIAQTLGKRFTRISLGGVYNQADIRGHRRTYVGALPGRIIQAVRNAGVKNPVILLDEIDKMSSGVQGDPGAALLEVLDPEQNCHFVDHYLNVPFDLSQVMFLATANRVTTISPALYDRMEIIYMTGYTQEEKFLITQRHLLPKQLSQHGLDSSLMEIPNESVKLLISSYTREAGVRNLERKLAALCRAVALKVAMNQSAMVDDVITGDNPTNEVNSKDKLNLPVVLDTKALSNVLGTPFYDGNEIWSRLGVAGVAVGLSVNEAGGNVLLVEANKMAPGTGQLELTGRLGTVIKESAILAYSWLRTVAHQYGLSGEDESTDLLGCTDVHIHFPAGAVGKEGPSAGITIATALISLFAQIPVAPDVALTGEITLRGLVLPVGGIKEKILAAHRAGLKRVIVPKKCDKYLSGIPKDILSDMKLVLVNHMSEVIESAFDGALAPVNRHSKMSDLECKL